MKKVGKIFAVLMSAVLIALSVPEIPAKAAVLGDDYPYKNYSTSSVDPWNFYCRHCTSFVAWRLNNTNGINFTNQYGKVKWGNANNWDDAARSLGIAVDNTPAVGAVAQTNSGEFGHVAWVAEVSGDSVTIEEYNTVWTPYAYNKRTVNASAFQYIHIKDLDPPGEDYGNDFYAYIRYLKGNLNVANEGWGNVATAVINKNDPRQIWHFIKTNYSTNTYKIVSLYDGRNIDVAGAGTDWETNIHMWSENGTNGQRWRIHNYEGAAAFSPEHALNLNMDVSRMSTDPGANIWIWTRAEGDGAQTFEIQKISSINSVLASNPGNDFYATISYKNTTLRTTGAFDDTKDGMAIKASTVSDLNDTKQIWHFIRQSNGSYKIVNEFNGWCMDSRGGIVENKRQIWTYFDDHGGTPERWYLVYSPTDDAYRFVTAMSYPNSLYSMDIPGGNTSGDEIPEIYEQNENSWQWFKINKLSAYEHPALPSAPQNIKVVRNADSTLKITWDEVPEVNSYDQRIYNLDVWDSEGHLVDFVSLLIEPEYTTLETFEDGVYSVGIKSYNRKIRDSWSEEAIYNFRLKTNEDISTLDISVTPYANEYDRAEHDAITSIKIKGSEILGNIPGGVSVSYSTDDGTTWTAEMPVIKDAGTLDVLVKISGDEYLGEWISGPACKAVVSPRSIGDSRLTIEDIPSCTYTGEEITPKIAIKDEGVLLTEGVDYTVSCSSNKNVGTANALIVGRGNYQYYTVKEFNILKMTPDIIMPESNVIEKTFGDDNFTIDSISHTGDGNLEYTAITGDDVIAIYKDKFSILKPGTAEVKVSLKETSNCDAAEDKTIYIKVNKKTISEINTAESYVYTVGSEGNRQEIDIFELLPDNIGTALYSVEDTDAQYVKEVKIDSDGILSYVVDD